MFVCGYERSSGGSGAASESSSALPPSVRDGGPESVRYGRAESVRCSRTVESVRHGETEFSVFGQSALRVVSIPFEWTSSAAVEGQRKRVVEW